MKASEQDIKIMKKPLPCPFCKSQDVFYGTDYRNYNDWHVPWIRCQDCGGTATAVLWNNRENGKATACTTPL